MYLKAFRLFVFLAFFTTSLVAQTYYVSQEDGNDNNNGLSSNNPFKTVNRALDDLGPGDTLLFMGEFVNDSFDPNYVYSNDIEDPYIWHQENTIRINNLNGTPNNYITLKAFDENTKLKGDGANVFRVTNSSYLNIEDFEIEGIVDQVSLATALALQFVYREEGTPPSLYRVQPGTSDEDVENMTFPILNNIKRPSYTDTRGIYFSNVHHINFTNNLVHHTTGNGFRVQGCDYIYIIGNEVHNTSRKSYSGTHGLVVTNAESFDDSDDYKIFILQNKVHHNYNEIYSWAPSKTIITPRIDEGKGISMQRNDIDDNDTPNNTNDDTGWLHGRFLVANNVTYWNGFSGIHSNDGLRMDFINNTSYLNSYTNTVTYANEEQRGNQIGMSAQRGDDFKFINNIIVVDTDWNGFPISTSNQNTLEVRNNIVFGINGDVSTDADVENIQVNTLEANPLFEDVTSDNYSLTENSPAIGYAISSFAPDTDFNGNTRDSNPDAGALEFSSALSIAESTKTNLVAYPNPVSNVLHIHSAEILEEIQVYNLLGQRVLSQKVSQQKTQVNVSALKSGLYMVSVGNQTFKIIKQ